MSLSVCLTRLRNLRISRRIPSVSECNPSGRVAEMRRPLNLSPRRGEMDDSVLPSTIPTRTPSQARARPRGQSMRGHALQRSRRRSPLRLASRSKLYSLFDTALLATFSAMCPSRLCRSDNKGLRACFLPTRRHHRLFDAQPRKRRSNTRAAG